jgi:hypothetical protein
MKSLDADTVSKMRELGALVRAALARNDPETAQALLREGWELIPAPRRDYDVSLSKVLGSIRLMATSGKPEYALAWVEELNGLDITAIDAEPHFLAGVAYYENGHLDLAAKHFLKADQVSKGRCFQGEDQRYRAFLRSRTA